MDWLRALGRRALVVARLTGLSAWLGVQGFYLSDNLTYAASIAYYALLSLFPFFLLALALLGTATADVADREAVLAFVLQYFPAQFDFITSQLDALRPLTLGVVGTITLVWGVLGVFGAISTAVNYAWGVQPPSYLKHKAFSFVMLLVAGLFLLVALLLISAREVVVSSWFAGILIRFPGLSLLSSFALDHAATLLFIVVVGLVFYVVPNTIVRFRDVWVGAIVTGLLWKAVSDGFSWYIRDTTRFTIVNGSIAAVVMFLMWVYIQAVILLFGAEFTAAYVRLRREQSGEASETTALEAREPSTDEVSEPSSSEAPTHE